MFGERGHGRSTSAGITSGRIIIIRDENVVATVRGEHVTAQGGSVTGSVQEARAYGEIGHGGRGGRAGGVGGGIIGTGDGVPGLDGAGGQGVGAGGHGGRGHHRHRRGHRVVGHRRHRTGGTCAISC